MKQDYSFKKGLGKGLKAVLGFVITATMITGFADVQIWDLIVQYVKPLIGGATVSTALFFVYNYVVYNWLGETPKDA